MRVSWTLAATGALFLALLGALLVLPGRLLAPDHRVQVAVGYAQQRRSQSVQAVPPVVHARLKAPRRSAIRQAAHPRPVAHRAAAASSLAAVIVTTPRPVVRPAPTAARPVVQQRPAVAHVAPQAPAPVRIAQPPRPKPAPT